MARLPEHQFLRFLMVGGLNTAFSYAVYAGLLMVGLPYFAANLGALLLGILFSFRTQGWLVFGNRDGRLIVRFAACWVVIFLFGIALIGSMIRVGLNAYWAGALAMGPVTVLSFLIQRFLVFGAARPRPNKNL